MSDIGRFRDRFVILFLTMAIAQLHTLLANRYGFFYPEVGVAFVLIAMISAVLAAAAKPPLIFHAVFALLAVGLTFASLRSSLFPNLRYRVIFPCLLAVTASAVLVLKKRFYEMALLLVAGFGVADVMQAAYLSRSAKPAEKVPRAGAYHHEIHIIFDSMIGLRGLPREIPACTAAAGAFDAVLNDGNFTRYGNAFSNYQRTFDSIGSIFNGKILDRPSQLITYPEQELLRNRYFESAHKRGYAVVAYQSDFFRFAPPSASYIERHTYAAGDLGILHVVPDHWPAKLGPLFLPQLPVRLLSRIPGGDLHLQFSPLASGAVWPGRLLEDINAATRNSLFVVHVFSPHYPYVQEASGKVRSMADWSSHERDAPLTEAAEYRRLYGLYCGQVEFLASQMGKLIAGLRQSGLYDDARVIVHGDHGSRLRLMNSGEFKPTPEGLADPLRLSNYDYKGDPPVRDLMNRFSALLAVKRPRASEPREIVQAGSILYFLNRDESWEVDPSDREKLNSAYLFSETGKPRAISLVPVFDGKGDE